MKETKKELKGNITEDQLRKMKKEISESLSRDRHKLLVEQPFVGNVIMRFDLQPVRDRRCRTACTDCGKTIYFDCSFYLSLTPEERVFVLAHECWHALSLTSQRKQSRDAELWNIASDMEINNILSDAASGTRAYVPPKNLMFPPSKMKGQSAETLYDWLLKQQEKNNLNNALTKMSRPDNGEGDEDGQGGSSSGKKQKQKQSQNGSGQGGQEKPDTSKDGKNTGKLEGQFDKHTYENDADDEGQEDGGKDGKDGKGKGKSGGPTDQWGEVGYDDDFKPSIPADAAERMREAAISAAQSYQREHGTLPAGVDGLLDKLAKPEIGWKELLTQFVTQCYGGKRQWLPPNRRHVHNDMYFQSRRNERIRGVVAIDTSGSCVGDLPKFFGELKGLIDSFGSYELTVICADAAVDQVDVYDDDNNPLELDTASDIKWSGGGGTDYSCVFKYVEDERLNPDFLIYLGDGYAALDVKDPPQYPVLWLITKEGTFDFCNWGKKIRFKESSWE